MKDVAALAGVSLKTVSRVINGEASVNADLRTRVEAAAEQLRYLPNLGATALRRRDGRSMTLGALVEDLSNPFFALVMRHFEDTVFDKGYSMIATSLEEQAELEHQVTTQMVRHRVDGMFIAPCSTDQSYLAREVAAGVAMVFVDRPPINLDADVVVSDNRRATRNAVKHLTDRGHTRIAYLGNMETIWTARERRSGYDAAMLEAGCPIDDSIIVMNIRSEEQARVVAHDMLGADEPPTAFFASQNLLTIGVVKALKELGLEHHVALVGYDDFTLADLLSPGISVVAQDAPTIGHTVAELLIGRIEGDVSPSKFIEVPTTFIARGSGEILA
jgi:LacI family transcriptional regulator